MAPELPLLRPAGRKQFLTLAEFKPYMWWRAPLKLAAGTLPGGSSPLRAQAINPRVGYALRTGRSCFTSTASSPPLVVSLHTTVAATLPHSLFESCRGSSLLLWT